VGDSPALVGNGGAAGGHGAREGGRAEVGRVG
jgi:hypothetical protein